MKSYDDELFKQKIRQASRLGFVTVKDIEIAFWSVCWDLRVAIQQQAPEKMDVAEEAFRKDFLPTFVSQIETELKLKVRGEL